MSHARTHARASSSVFSKQKEDGIHFVAHFKCQITILKGTPLEVVAAHQRDSSPPQWHLLLLMEWNRRWT
jgi:hypothetical protein